MTEAIQLDPKLIEYANEGQARYLAAIAEHGSYRAAARALGVNKSSVQKAVRSVQTAAARQGYAPGHFAHGVAPGYAMGKVTVQRGPSGEVERVWERQSPEQDRQREAMQAAYDAMAADLPREKPVQRPAHNIEALCNLAVFTDYHMGQLAWHKEGGADWNLKIAEGLLFDSFAQMIDAAQPAATFVLCMQGDFLHTDGLLPLTPAHKHVLDADSRFSKIIDAAVRVLRRLLAHALARHARVHLVICEGNHDETASLWMRKMFAALYENEPRLTVNDSELPFYVYQHGNVMLAFHHGHKVKNEQLPLLFAAQYAQMWGATTKRYAHCGHRHHTDEKEYAGMTVTQHPTLAARDAHASRGGWISERAANLITYHDKFGQVARTIVCPEMFDEAA